MSESSLPTGSFDEIQRTHAQSGPAAAADRLIELERLAGNYDGLFYAMLLRARVRLGVDPIPTRPAVELPEPLHAAYEDAIRDAARTVGSLLIEAGDIPRAWNYFRLIGDLAPIHDALEQVVLQEEDDHHPLVELALNHGIHPKKGFDLVLERQGICNAISVFTGFESALSPDVRAHCARRLVQSLHEQLLERMRYEILQNESRELPSGAGLSELMAGRDWLFAEDAYLIDLSHLAAVVQAGIHLPPRDVGLRPAIELCDYGEKLPAQLQSAGEPPFERIYPDHRAYFRVLVGEEIEAGLQRFRAKAAAADPEQSTRPAETLINLLLNAGRPDEAAAAARQFLLRADDRQLCCPGALELTRRQGDFREYAEVARHRGDAVHFLAGLLSKSNPPQTQI